ncbi:MAG: hypothetical protein OEU92_28390 [Alphaproteobacteria bacterium]|nr:hypothetical protein [Alphaproteobacteria bacterium]
MRRVALFISSLALASSLAATAAAAQSAVTGLRIPCHDATEIARQLSKKYEEAPIAFGLQSNGNLLQIYTSETKHTWTVVSTTPAGKSCIVAAGKRWENLPFIKHDPMA